MHHDDEHPPDEDYIISLCREYLDLIPETSVLAVKQRINVFRTLRRNITLKRLEEDIKYGKSSLPMMIEMVPPRQYAYCARTFKLQEESFVLKVMEIFQKKHSSMNPGDAFR
jgi:hypothetical protein